MQVLDNIISKVQTTVSDLATILMDITKSTFCSITYVVDDNRSKTVKGVKQVQKMVRISHVALNHNYTNKVNNLNGTTDFVAQEMKGKTRISSTLIQSDKTGELMIDGKVLKSEAVTLLGYFHNGTEISEAQAIAMDLWAPAYYTPAVKTTMGRGSVSIEDDFNIINTYLCRIKEIKIQGTTYELS